MRKWERLLILALALGNVALLVHVLISPEGPSLFVSEAHGQNRALSAGTYAITTADITSSRAALWVVDNKEKRMLVYAFPSSVTDRRITPLGRVDLRRDFGADLAGDVVIIPGKISGEREAVYVLDVAGGRILAYIAEGGRNEIRLIGARNLDEDFKE
jgi:hypothetical protein